MQFTKATKSKAKLRLGLIGPPSAGKTYTALSIAQGLSDKIALIDTENASASKYADKFSFDTLVLTNFAPRNYVTALKAAADGGYGVVIVDSISHAWEGEGGALEMAATAAKKMKNPNSYTAWRDVTPEHNAMVNAIIQSPLHVIVTCRTKMEYVLEDVNGKKQPRKIGLAPVTGKGMEYEMDIVLDLDESGNQAIVTKTRYSDISGKVLKQPGADFGKELGAWLSDGAEVKIGSADGNPYATVLREAIEQSENIAGLDNVAVAIKEATPRLAPAEIVSLRNAFAARRKHFVTT